MRVGLVVVSHSARLAEGVCELAEQMAPDVVMVAAGGTDDGGIGTGFEKIQRAVHSADRGVGAVILVDLGSAVMTAESVLEFLDPQIRTRVILADAPLVEGAVAAAVSAQSGGDVQEVLAAAESAGALYPGDTAAGGTDAGDTEQQDEGPATAEEPDSAPSCDLVGSWKLINPLGLHARPAAVIARAMAELDAEITINGVDATSVMLLMTLGLGCGGTLRVCARGRDAAKAVEMIGAEVRHGFGEIQDG